jgi:hypothetical protein
MMINAALAIQQYYRLSITVPTSLFWMLAMTILNRFLPQVLCIDTHDSHFLIHALVIM